MKKALIIIIPIFLVGLSLLLLGVYLGFKYFKMQAVDSFEDCAAMGYPVMDSYPQQCMTPDGRSFTDLNAPTIVDPGLYDIEVYSPQIDQFISSPYVVEGNADASWFWEGTFTVELVGEAGEVVAIANAIIPQGGNWTDGGTQFFQATLEFDPEVVGKTGYIKLRKANASGLPENDKEYTVKVRFNKSVQKDGCIITGCSSHICSETDQVSDCAFREEYVCYSAGICEKQSDGMCGWTQTPELLSCLERYD